MKRKKEFSFEEDLERLEAIVTALEEGGLSLDEALKKFEEGMKLTLRCERTLTEAERKIEILTKNQAGELEPEPFCDEESSAPGPPEPLEEDDQTEEDPDLLF